MARVPVHIRRVLADLDAEARAVIGRHTLPAWIGLYRIPKPRDGETITILWQRRESVLRGREPVYKGTLPLYAAIIPADGRLDPSARHIARLWMAWERRRTAIRRKDSDARRAAEALFNGLLKQPPSRDRGARNIERHNVVRADARAIEWQRWRAEADRIAQPGLSDMARAELVKRRLGLTEHAKTIARRLD